MRAVAFRSLAVELKPQLALLFFLARLQRLKVTLPLLLERVGRATATLRRCCTIRR